ncbi:bacillithiol biosynthesis cysteine-adding enzyme BshC [Sediminibacillus massiliensis]|uniref:bacillithiol biosynthesis cysteine-adding enzyme BshC n=1 Tax=Sediminibacillus massiliensis TaxID=1926277 RepID=UPI0009887837|nr:bacillithiol biosynthesis cysteine-adding enzyme BshC [Sediminibacillus massiliensis]
MRIDPINLNTQSRLMAGYRNGDKYIHQKFDYNPFDSDTYSKRVSDLNKRVYDRAGLAAVLEEANKKWHAPDSTMANIDRLRNPDSVVVIGGQQAGLLTGPLYTIHKMISIINFAHEQEKQLQIPVVPVFWIAGEDHDFAEINHIMAEDSSNMKKIKIDHNVVEKKSVSDLEMDKEAGYKWLKRVFQRQTETEYTRSLLEELEALLEQSVTYVDFFARITFRLLDGHGLVLIDSGDPNLRKLEGEHFVKMIEQQPIISSGVNRSLNDSNGNGYPIAMDAEEDAGHIFYHIDGERVLLFKDTDGLWKGKQGECEFTTEELIDIARNTPEKLSNNVVTRPLMQEFLFPTLAFIAGPGEVGYWSVLKTAFHALTLLMPPVLPRLSLTLIDRQLEKRMEKLSITATDAVGKGVDTEKINWLSSQMSPPIKEIADQLKKTVEVAHKPLRKAAADISDDLDDVAEKNLAYLFNDIDYLERRVFKALQAKHSKTISDYDHIQLMLHPEGGLQERSWNVLAWINRYGRGFLDELIEYDYDYQKEHYAAFL